MNRTMKPARLILFAALSLSGCVTYRTTSDGITRARLNETVLVGTRHVTPLALLEDSRCPLEVQCIRAGDVRISARIEAQTVELTLARPAVGIELVEVMPPRRKDQTPYPEDYRFGFHPGS